MDLLDTIKMHEKEEDVLTMTLVALGSIGYSNHSNGPAELNHRGSTVLVQKVLSDFPSNDTEQRHLLLSSNTLRACTACTLSVV